MLNVECGILNKKKSVKSEKNKNKYMGRAVVAI
jgi:hypothetical protein